jgi:hypothetical protein
MSGNRGLPVGKPLPTAGDSVARTGKVNPGQRVSTVVAAVGGWCWGGGCNCGWEPTALPVVGGAGGMTVVGRGRRRAATSCEQAIDEKARWAALHSSCWRCWVRCRRGGGAGVVCAVVLASVQGHIHGVVVVPWSVANHLPSRCCRRRRGAFFVTSLSVCSRQGMPGESLRRHSSLWRW